ncbi:A24 family peptidase [Clostridium sp.]|uniref:prepilin peptidase n=1 Tax=Clostridium sp. TaxID=1506 RepID=UPI001D3FEE10|nr:A24 family peptidase [Clostridium sp.]MBS5986079.1 prepilin peptidase [Clostridium sp.]
MSFIIGVIVFFFGTLIGSFLNVCIFRIPNEESIVYPPSHCGNCNHRLKVLDLIPIFSYIFLRGRCRYCKGRVSLQYPLVEGLTGVLFVLIYLKYGLTIELFKFMVFTALLIVIGIIDLKTQDIYDSTVILTGVVGIGFIIIEFFMGNEINISALAIGILVPVIFLAIFSAFGAMGWGDVELVGVTGLFLIGKFNIINLFLSIIIGGSFAIGFMVLKKKEKGNMMAFGPYIAMASYITLLFPNEIINLYVNTFL